jgi:hypothetical protein
LGGGVWGRKTWGFAPTHTPPTFSALNHPFLHTQLQLTLVSTAQWPLDEGGLWRLMHIMDRSPSPLPAPPTCFLRRQTDNGSDRQPDPATYNGPDHGTDAAADRFAHNEVTGKGKWGKKGGVRGREGMVVWGWMNTREC